MDYFTRGWHTLPLKHHEKVPATKHGVKDAELRSTDNIAEGLAEGLNLGVATGQVSGIFVVDVDPRNNGAETFEELENRNGFPATYRVNTPTGGFHLYYQYPAGVEKLAGKLGEGIDIKSNGGYVVAPPSTHPQGGQYEVVDGSAVVSKAPEWLVSALEQKKGTETHEERVWDPTDRRPGTLYDNFAKWEEILEPAGYKFHHEDLSGVYWTRPGKEISDGLSLSTNYMGSGLLHCFTDSADFEASTTYSKQRAYAILYHGGDVSEAIFDLAENWVPANEHRFVSGTDGSGSISSPPPPKPDEDYQFEPAFSEDSFVGKYLAYCREMTDASEHYGEACALSLLSGATPLLRAKLGPYPKGLRTNLYLLLVGGSTRSRKSTSQGIMTDLLDNSFPRVKLPNRMTTEALINDMSMRKGSATMWCPDEFGAMLAQINKRDYLKGIEELLLTIYGGDDYEYNKVDGDAVRTIRITQPHLGVLGASTPETIALSGPNAMLGGLLPRFGIVFPTVLPNARPAQDVRDLSGDKVALRDHLFSVGAFSQRQIHMSFTRGALELLNEAEYKIVDTGTHTARLPTALYKVAVLSAAGDLRGEVTVSDAESAVRAVGRWVEGANNLQPYLRGRSQDMEFERYMSLALDALKDNAGNVHRSVIARAILVDFQKMNRIEATLVDRGYITVDSVKNWKVNN